ncbi:MAG: hypothetical protein GQ538_00975 [Xanthomonadales bacterium]|nr:hypothetical protein [Xanthomonadales bacterium]
MIDMRQHAYLDAMGIEVWSLRESALPSPPQAVAFNSKETAPRLKIGSGSGGILLICSADVDSASRLANDISRALGSVPVWAWPDEEADTESDTFGLASAVDEKLFTTVAVFGDELAGRFFDGDLPGAVNSASLVVLPSMQDIQSRADARQSLWVTFCRSGMVSQREQQT